MNRPLVRYIGFEQPKRSASRRMPTPVVPRHPLGERALNMFQSGHDTLYVATALGISEPDALRIISNERSRRKGLRSPYEAQP